MLAKITQYGLGVGAGGWDGASDSGTDAFKGSSDNLIVSGVSCALSPSMRKKLGAHNGDWIVIMFPNAPSFTYIRRVDDATSALLLDDRVDLFNAYAFDRQVPSDFADVKLLSTPAWATQAPKVWSFFRS